MGLFSSVFKFVKNIFGAIGDVLGYVLGFDSGLEDKYKGQLVNKQSNIAKIPVIYGERLVGGTRVFVSTGGGKKNQYLYIALVLSEGEVESIGNIYINDVLSTDSKFNNKVTIYKYTGTDTQSATSLFNDANDPWTSAHQLKGVAYLAMRFKYDQDVFSGVPEVRAVVKGRKVYDPRTTTTAWSDNPALCLRDYLTNTRYGKGIPTSAIDDASFIQAANDCEVEVTPYNGGANIQLFKFNSIVDTGETLFKNVKKILASMRGIMPYSNGQYSIIVDKEEDSVFELNENNILSEIKVVSSSKDNKYNQVIAKFPNPEKRWELDSVIYPESGSTEETQFLTEDNQQVLSKEITLDNVTNHYRAYDLARIACLASRNQTLTVSLTCTSEALQLAVGDIVSVNHESMGWTGAAIQEFRIMGMVLADEGEVQLTLQQYDSSIYPWVEQSEQTAGPETTLPDPFATEAVTNATSTGHAVIQNDGTSIYFYDIEWTESDDALVDHYLIEVNKDDGSTLSLAAETLQTQNTSFRYMVADASLDYGFTVIAVNGAGTRSLGVDVSPVEVVIDTTAPGVPTSPQVTGTFKQIFITWTNPTDSDFSHIEIKRSASANEGEASYLNKINGEKYIDGDFTNTVTYYYWIRALDRTGNASDWVSCGSGTSLQLVTDDFADGIITIDHIDTVFTNVIDAKAPQTSVDAINANITTVESDIDSISNEQQNFGDTIDTVATRMLTLATRQDEFTGLMRDAGITVDPNNGTVSIQAVETLRSETETSLNQVTIDLDAAEAEISLKASTAYVNNAIASAVLDSADLASLNALEAKIDQAEIDIDANTASIALKADSTTVTGLDVRISQAEVDINAAEASILLKADQSDFTNLENRVTTAEIDINALDSASITQTVIDSRANARAIDTSAVTSLKDILNQYKARESTINDLAFARQQIFADVNEQREAVAQAKTELGALIDDNAASIISESTARANADSALASDITALTATVNTNTASIQTESTARADADTALASDISSLSTTVDQNTADIATETTARTTADTALASDITALEASVTDLETDTIANAAAITSIDTRVTTAEGNITSNATSITSLQSDITDLETDTASNATAITNLTTTVTQNGTDITSNATAITGLTTTVNGHTTSISENLTSINGVKAQYSVTINNNDHVTGFGLVSDIIDGNPTSSFTVNADSFGIGATGATDKYPFVVYTTNTNVTKDGEVITIPAGTYISDAFIQDAAINTAKIQDAAITNAKIDSLNADKITAGFISADRIESGSIDAKIANIGWAKITDVSIENADITSISADKITAGTIDADRLSIDGVTLDTNVSGQLIINDSGVNTTQIASNAVTIPVSSYTSGTLTPSGGSEATIQQVTITSTGEPIFINFTCICTSTAVFGQSSTNLKLYRGTTEVQDFGQMAKMEYGNALPLAISITDTPTAGTHTYYIKSSTFISVNYKSRSMTALEVKR